MPRITCIVALLLLMGTVASVAADSVQLDLTNGFNVDAWCGPKEQQECYTDGSHDLIELFGNLDTTGNGNYILDTAYFILADSSSGGFGETYSISSNWFHPLYITGTEGSPEDGVLTGADRDYHVASTLGNDTLSGDWTEVADPSTYDIKENAVVIGSYHSTASWQIDEVEIELSSAQKGKYVDVNFILCALDQADKARDMRIVALYGASGTDEEVIYSFETADGGSGPLMTDTTAPDDFAIVYTMSKALATTSGATGAVIAKTSNFFEFDEALELDGTKDLWGFRLEDVNPSLNWNGRGLVILAATATPAPPVEVQLDLTDGFNTDAWCGPKEQQECYTDGSHDLIELFGNLEDGNGNYILDAATFIVADSSSGGFGETYSISSNWFHPLYITGTEGSPEDGVLTGADRDYHVASTLGNDTLSGDWTEVADPSSYDIKENAVVIGSYHSTASWQIDEVEIELPSGQKSKYASVNFLLCALDQADKARDMRIVALYGASGTDEEVIYSFETADGGSGPLMTDTTAPDDFAIVYTMSKALATTSGATGAVIAKTSNFFEFDEPLELDDTKDLWGFRLEDVNPSLNWNSRGLVIFAATALTTGSAPSNSPPVADAGSDQTVTDTDSSGSETVTLDASASSDSDGTITSYVWKEGAAQIATGETASVSLTTGSHTITLEVTDNDSDTDSDTVLVTVNVPPVADAGSDQQVEDTDSNGSQAVTLDGSGSSDSDGTIASYVWKEGAGQIATGQTASVTLDVGSHTITLEVTDNNGGTDSDTVLITVTPPNSGPVADAGSDQEVEDTDYSGSEAVTLDGSGSSDSDGTIVSYAWKEGETQIATGQTASATLDVGDHTITLVVTDDDDATASDTVIVKVYTPSTPVQLDLTDGFNMDGVCGPKEYQECRIDGAHDLFELFGVLPDGNGQYVRGQSSMLVADSTGEAYAYSITGMSGHPINYSGTQGLPLDGILTSADDREYYAVSVGGNDLLSGDWTEVADPSSYDVKSNCVVVGSAHSTATWQIASVTIELPSAQKVKYADINFVLAAMDQADRARNMRIVALYGATGTDEEEIYAFSTADGGDGPKIIDTTAPSGFASVYTMSKYYSSTSGATGAVYDATSNLWEFDEAIDLNSSKTLWGIRVEDVNPSLQWNSRGVVIFAATAMTAGASNTAPVADAGSDQTVHDTNGSGDALVSLDGSGSSDSDGTISSWVWSEGGTPIASGETASAYLTLGSHTITLTVTDNDSGTAADTLVVHVNAVPLAAAGDDQLVYDDDQNGSETVTLDASDSTDSDGTIVSYVWKEGETQIATGETASVSLTVGTHTITMTATDDDGGSAADTLTVWVSDNHPPVADAGDDTAVEDSDDDGSVTVTLDGTGSSDSDGSITSYVWKDASGTQIATGSTASVNLNVGINDITLQVTDDDNDIDLQVLRLWVYPKVDYWVNGATGDNGNPGTAALPWATVDYAVDHCSSGDVVMVREGIYRETVSPSVSGTSGDRCVLMGYPFERVVISGADQLTGWTQCTEAIAKNNPNYASIYYVDITWEPNRLSQDEIDLAYGRTEGWLLCEGGTTTTLIDTTNRTEADDYWIGATCWLWDVSVTNHYQREVIDFDNATGALTIDGTWAEPESGADRYYLYNMVQLISGAGEWAVEDMGGGTYRIYCWALGDGDPDNYMMEAARRSPFVVGIGTTSYWTYDNLEMRHGLTYCWGTWSSGGAGHNILQNCAVHHNDNLGVYGRFNDYSEYRNNYIAYNGSGISNSASNNVVIENNEVCFNSVDGVLTTGPKTDLNPDVWTEYVTVRGNYIHDHNLWGHPDNCQAYRNIRYLTVEDNFIINSGQSYMMEETDQVLFDNNVIVGSAAYMIINGHSNTEDTTCENNTLAYAGYGLVNHGGYDGYYYKNNILVEGHSATVWGGVGPTTSYSSDYNLFWHGPDISYNVVTWDGSGMTLAAYSTASGEDTHSVYADPRFENAPAYFVQLDTSKTHLFTTTMVYMASGYTSLFEVGDKVEVNWDGVVRTVQSVGADYITFSPGDDYIAFKANQITNWKDNTDFDLDFSLKVGSPAIGADEDSNDMGSDIDVQAYRYGDFNGDGRRDIPSWPVEE